jgi:hypothetical protein
LVSSREKMPTKDVCVGAIAAPGKEYWTVMLDGGS